MGLLLTDLRADFAAARLLALEGAATADLEDIFGGLAARAEAWFAEERIAPVERRIVRTVDMRYAGQNYELPVTVPAGPVTAATLDRFAEGFAAAHERMSGFVAQNAPVQVLPPRIGAFRGGRQGRTGPAQRAGAGPLGGSIGRR